MNDAAKKLLTILERTFRLASGSIINADKRCDGIVVSNCIPAI